MSLLISLHTSAVSKSALLGPNGHQITLDAVHAFDSTEWKVKSHVRLGNSETGAQTYSPLEITSISSQGYCRERFHTKENT